MQMVEAHITIACAALVAARPAVAAIVPEKLASSFEARWNSLTHGSTSRTRAHPSGATPLHKPACLRIGANDMSGSSESTARLEATAGSYVLQDRASNESGAYSHHARTGPI